MAEENADKFYHAQGSIEQVMPWSDCKESYCNGFTSGYQVSRAEVMAEAEKLAEALRKIAEYSTSEEKYNSYEQGWHGTADFAARELYKWKEFKNEPK